MKRNYYPVFLLMAVGIAFTAFVNQSQREVFRPGKDYALFFAVSNYKNSSLTNLPNSIPDARAIAEVLEKSYGFKTEVIADPTLDVIEQKLNEYREKFAKGTFAKDGQLFLFFSGHGVKEYNNGYFLPTDADPSRLSRTAFAYNIWRPIVSEIQCQHILVAVDACYSVTFDPSWESKNDPKFQRIGELTESERILANHKDYKNRIFFTADAKENIVPGRSNFARKLLEGLSANQYKGSFITSSELFASYVQKAQPAPRANHFEGDDPNSSFLFFPTQQVKEESQPLVDQRQRDIEAYWKVRQSPSAIACQQYLSDFPNGAFRDEVTGLLIQIQDEQEWQIVILKKTKEAYENYLLLYPNGKYVDEVTQLLNGLQNNKINNFSSAFAIKVHSVEAVAYQIKDGGRLVSTKHAESTNQITNCFYININPNIKLNIETFYIRIINPKGETLAEENLGSGIFFHNEYGGDMHFTLRKDFYYEGKVAQLCSDWKPNQSFMAGTYGVEIYNKGFLVGKTSFTLK